MVGSVTLMTGGMYCPPCPTAPVSKVVQSTIVGQVGEDAKAIGQVSDQSRVVGMIRTCPGDDEMTDLSMVRGDNADFPFVVLDDPSTLTGTWTWDGSLTVLSDDTSGVTVGDWIRLSSSYSWFEVSAVTPNVDVTIVNQDELTVPSGTGAEGASPVDLTGGVVRASAKIGTREAFKSTTYTDPDGIEITDASAGEGIWHITPHDQKDDSADEYCWDIETNRRGTLRSNSGTATPETGSQVLTFSDAAVASAARCGDIFVGTGAGLSANQISILITETPDTDDSLDSDQLKTDYTGLQTEAAFAFELYRGIRKTPDGLTGTLTLNKDGTL